LSWNHLQKEDKCYLQGMSFLHNTKRKIFLVLTLLLCWSVLLLNQSCSKTESDKTTEVPVSMLDQTPDFIGSVECKSCHETEYAEWSTSDHAKAMMEPNDTSVLGDFNNASFVADGVESKFFRRNGKFYINTEGKDGIYKDHEVKYTFGIYPLQQYLVEQEGGRMQATRVAWDSREQKWFNLSEGEIIDHSDWLHWTRSSMTWNTMCSHCHSTNLAKNFDNKSNTFETTWDLVNVGCEGCHGPGKEHFKAATAGKYEDPSYQDSHLVQNTGEQNTIQVQNCAPCHARRSMIQEPHNFDENFDDQYIPSTLTDNLYHADGQILDEVYVYGSFIQSKMYAQGVKCTDCHNPHRAALKLEGNALCMQCHEPEYDTKAHHFHDLKAEGAECINCHMPGKYYMVNDFRRDHSFRVPRPDLTVEFNTPNSCNGCHEEKTAQWASDWIKQWYGDERPSHYSETLALARERNPEDAEKVITLVKNTEEPEIVRATALEYLVESGAPESIEILRDMLANRSSLMRLTAVNQLYNLNQQDRMALLLPLLGDEARTVRLAAASALSDVPELEIPAQYIADYRKANQEYRSSLLLNADFQSGQMLLGQYYSRTGDMARAEEAYKRSLELDSLYIPSRVNLAQLYNRMEENEKALNLVESVIQIQPEFAEAYYMQGLILAESGNLEDAALSLEKATSMSPYYTRAYYNLGLIYQNLGRVENAENAYLNGLATAQEDESLHNALAILYIQNNQLAKARTHVQFLQKLYPNNPQIQRMAEMVQ